MQENKNTANNICSYEYLRLCMKSKMDELLGTLYQYGGSYPHTYGLDCSEFACNVLIAAEFKIPDMTAADLRKYFKGCEIYRYQARVGDLYFYGKTRVSHVCMCYKVINEKSNYRILAGANSGTSKTKTEKYAWDHDAFVKLVKDTYRIDELDCIVNPFLKK